MIHQDDISKQEILAIEEVDEIVNRMIEEAKKKAEEEVRRVEEEWKRKYEEYKLPSELIKQIEDDIRKKYEEEYHRKIQRIEEKISKLSSIDIRQLAEEVLNKVVFEK